ncbi:MAG TPA: hypothetical protein VGH97_08940 [Thermoanaerobaculia bacterium]|jgi:hypothetical protein
MQIPYDLEFVENRPRVPVRVQAVALHEPRLLRQNELPGHQHDVFDTLLAWAHRMLRRFEKN